MIPIPIFIHVREKTDKEIREEIERDIKWRKMMEEEEAARHAREERERVRKLIEKEELRRKISNEYEDKRRENPWEYSLLPEGWSIFGTPLKIVDEI